MLTDNLWVKGRTWKLVLYVMVCCALACVFSMAGCEDDKLRRSVRCYDSVVGRAMTIEDDFMMEGRQVFEWYEYFGSHTLSDTDTLLLSFAIIPFADDSSQGTRVTFDMYGGATFLRVWFRDGKMNDAIAYRQNQWNCVVVTADCSAQSYVVELNGKNAGSFAFDPRSESVQAFRLSYSTVELTTTAQESRSCWIDSISLVRLSNGTSEILYEEAFDGGGTFELGRGILVTDSPPRE